VNRERIPALRVADDIGGIDSVAANPYRGSYLNVVVKHVPPSK